MLRASLTGLDRTGLKLALGLFFLALAMPTAILVHHAYGQLKWEAFHQHRVLAEELVSRIDARLVTLVGHEEARSFSDYAFLVVAGDPSASFVQRSVLSAYPIRSPIPGLVGYFQVDDQGKFSTPLLPELTSSAGDYGIPDAEREQRLVLQQQLHAILSENRLVGTAPVAREQVEAELALDGSSLGVAADDAVAESSPQADAALVSQAAFDQLKSETPTPAQQVRQRQAFKVADLELDASYEEQIVTFADAPADELTDRRTELQALGQTSERRARKEQSALPESSLAGLSSIESGESAGDAVRVTTFESEIEPFEFSLLDSGHMVLFRRVWRDGQRYIQGALIEGEAFLSGTIESGFRDTALSQMSNLVIAHRDNVFTAFSSRSTGRYLRRPEELSGALLYRSRLSAPLDDLELILSITQLPAGPGSAVITWVSGILAVVLCAGVYLMYRLGARQIDLTRQQQDFVSAVSHELKTPLTSIRMYGEMLREGWASEERKKIYYDYIFHESERLSRLISNVLQLARMTRNELSIEPTSVVVAELMDEIRSKVSSQIEQAGFELVCRCPDDAARARITVDADCFSQIAINLVDNATKFSAKATRKVIEVDWRRQRDGSVRFAVRDYGPGVPKDQMRKIFGLFYRSRGGLTRETVGTGIGLALVHQLARGMNAQVDVVNRDPGAEFAVTFPAPAG